MRRFFWLVAPALAGLACGSEGAPEASAWSPETAWRLEVQWTVGGAEAEGLAAFGDLTGLAVDAAGRAWVVDRQTQYLTVIGPDGAVERTVGRQGAGPGEFEGIYGVTVAPDGRVWVPDTRNARFTVFDGEGTLVATWQRPANCYGYTWPGRAVADGRIVDVTCGPAGYQVVRYDTATQTYRDTVAVPHAQAGPALEPFAFRGERGSAVVGVPFAPGQIWALNADGTVWVGWSGDYLLRRGTLDGDTLALVRRDVAAIPVSGDEREAAIERIERVARGSAFDDGRIPAVHPLFARLLEDDRGYLWVLRRTGDGWAFDVFDPGHRYLGSVTPPAGVQIEPYLPLTIRGDAMWTITRDALDAPAVTRLRIVRPAS